MFWRNQDNNPHTHQEKKIDTRFSSIRENIE